MAGPACKGLCPKRLIRRMKFSIEAKVAAAVAMAFVALSIGAIAQEQSQRTTGGPTNSPALSQMSAGSSE